MAYQEMKGFPDYMWDNKNEQVVSKLRRHTVLKWRAQYQKTALCVQVTQNGKRRWLFKARLQYCIQHGIGYDDIPEGLFVTGIGGELKVTDLKGKMEWAKNVERERRKKERINRIDEKIHELEIMRRAYTDGSDTEIIAYIENKKYLFVSHHCKKYGMNWKKAELHYNMALERMINSIKSPYSQVTELTCSMMAIMGKVRLDMKSEKLFYEND